MGGLVATNDVTIAIQRPKGKLFDFHHSESTQQLKAPLAYPSFLSHDNHNAIFYVQRAKFTDR